MQRTPNRPPSLVWDWTSPWFWFWRHPHGAVPVVTARGHCPPPTSFAVKLFDLRPKLHAVSRCHLFTLQTHTLTCPCCARVTPPHTPDWLTVPRRTSASSKVRAPVRRLLLLPPLWLCVYMSLSGAPPVGGRAVPWHRVRARCNPSVSKPNIIFTMQSLKAPQLVSRQSKGRVLTELAYI